MAEMGLAEIEAAFYTNIVFPFILILLQRSIIIFAFSIIFFSLSSISLRTREMLVWLMSFLPESTDVYEVSIIV